MTTTIPVPPTSWSSSTVARVAQAYGIARAALTSCPGDLLLVDARWVAMALLADSGRGSCWRGTVLQCDDSRGRRHLAVLRRDEASASPSCGRDRFPSANHADHW